ncbi:helix-turn-helix domain-containing protein [Pedobacter sp. SYP-B3415]|uniref:AraC family transcriptional regulator n=1 Tax=Pedobacter sp. SYP-B3415 TaxID=2496641 RepID=UPI00101DF00E|nr:helix-turn-helix domain-containing protein [Pedobacter sp. SYP-B3415]
MNYQTFLPHPELAPLVKCYWTLEVPASAQQTRQRIVPDGCIEMAFILADDVRRFTTEDKYHLQPRSMVLGQITEPFFIEPVGEVQTFAVRFYPLGFANFIDFPLSRLADTETPVDLLFPDEAVELNRQIRCAVNTAGRIEIIEKFLMERLSKQTTIDVIVKSTFDALAASNGNAPIHTILGGDMARRRQLERKFRKQIGLSPKVLGRVIRLQAALKLLLNGPEDSLTKIAYEAAYYDQAHFIRDFREFTGTSPRQFLDSDLMALSSLFYKDP